MMDAAEYCREIEAYLCRKNEGHLIRIVGPVFEQVTGWATQGVPLPIAFRGIDRYCERYYAKGPRRRPVRVEFCEADILDLFDDWRRAVGVSSANAGGEHAQAAATRDTLPAHLDRAIARLTSLRGSDRSTTFRERVDAVVRELDTLRGSATRARGDARATILAKLSVLDAALLRAALSEIDDGKRATLQREAENEIAPFAARMADDVRMKAVEAALDRLVRDTISLPRLAVD